MQSVDLESCASVYGWASNVVQRGELIARLHGRSVETSLDAADTSVRATVTFQALAALVRTSRMRCAVPRFHDLEFRTEAFNLSNTPLFTQVGNSLGGSSFGRITTAQAERQVQFGLKLYF